MNQCFLEAKGEDRLDEYIYPLRPEILKFYANALLHHAYRYIFMQISSTGHIVSALSSPQYCLCLLGFGFYLFRPELIHKG